MGWSASLGNAGKGKAGAGAVDLVITPTLGTGLPKNPWYRHTRPGVNTLASK